MVMNAGSRLVRASSFRRGCLLLQQDQMRIIATATSSRSLSIRTPADLSKLSTKLNQMTAVPAVVDNAINLNVHNGPCYRQKAWKHDGSKEKTKKKKKDKKASRKGLEDEPSTTETEAPAALEMEAVAEELYVSDDEGGSPDDEEDEDVALPDVNETKDKMMAIVSKFEASLKSIRGAEPTIDLFDRVSVDAYGSPTPLQSVAQVVIVSPTLATATCFDPSLAKPVRTALAEQLQLNPHTDGNDGVVHIPLPRVSLETRQQTASALTKRAESYRRGIRKVRKKSMDVAKQGVAGKLEGISKDDAFRVQQELEAATEAAIQKLNVISEQKHNSIMQVD